MSRLIRWCRAVLREVSTGGSGSVEGGFWLMIVVDGASAGRRPPRSSSSSLTMVNDERGCEREGKAINTSVYICNRIGGVGCRLLFDDRTPK